jgi:phenylpropionate dioxygenase-like ring-hydroxylating dioxygenase large terminal subunit
MTFEDEQRALAAACWQFIGMTDDLVADDAWIRRSVFGTDVFVQRFGNELRGYHNVCAHRGFPLRREPAGVGPVRCGFHGWGYNKDGVPTTIPRNAELFGLSREQRETLALPAIRVETIGRFMFAAIGAAPALADYLGPYADVYRAVDAALGALIVRDSVELAAHWSRHVEISLDDYHLDTIHPTTFGARSAAPVHEFVYRRDQRHSCYLRRRDPAWSFDAFWTDVHTGVMDQTGYKIFNVFPGIVLATMRDAVVASAVAPMTATRTRLDSYVLRWAGAPAEGTEEIATYFARVFAEDREACERWQQGSPRAGVLGRLEERVGWFRAAYDEVMARRTAAE